MKHVSAYLLIFAICWHLFAELGIYISFKINQDYIAEFLCIEKDIPESTCNGCCQLKEKLETHQEQTKDTAQSVNKKIEIQYFTHHLRFIHTLTEFKNVPTFFYLNNTSKSSSSKIFHPPRIKYS